MNKDLKKEDKKELTKENTQKAEKLYKVIKIKKNITSGIAFVQATFYNTIVT